MVRARSLEHELLGERRLFVERSVRETGGHSDCRHNLRVHGSDTPGATVQSEVAMPGDRPQSALHCWPGRRDMSHLPRSSPVHRPNSRSIRPGFDGWRSRWIPEIETLSAIDRGPGPGNEP